MGRAKVLFNRYGKQMLVLLLIVSVAVGINLVESKGKDSSLNEDKLIGLNGDSNKESTDDNCVPIVEDKAKEHTESPDPDKENDYLFPKDKVIVKKDECEEVTSDAKPKEGDKVANVTNSKPEQTPTTESDTKPEGNIKPEARPEVKPKPEAKPKPKPSPEVKPDTKPNPTPDPTPPKEDIPEWVPEPDPVGWNEKASEELFSLANANRIANGLRPEGKGDASLKALANKRSKAISIDYSHNGAEKAEILWKDYGAPNPKRAIEVWLNSPGHRDALMIEREGVMSFSVYEENGYTHYVGVYGSR